MLRPNRQGALRAGARQPVCPETIGTGAGRALANATDVHPMTTLRSFSINGLSALVVPTLAAGALLAVASQALAQEQLPWGQSERSRVVQPNDQGPSYSGGPPSGQGDTYAQRDQPRGDSPYGRGPDEQRDSPTVYPERRTDDGPSYRPAQPVYPSGPSGAERGPDRNYGDRGPDRLPDGPVGQPYDSNKYGDQDKYGDRGPSRAYEPAPSYPEERAPPRRVPYARGDQSESRTYSNHEIRDAGHRFFGRINEGLANVIEHAFKRGGRPNGFILGEEGGGAFIAGLRYGEGTLHMKDGTRQKVYWQGPSIGYDFGAEGSKAMILVYDLEHPGKLFSTFGGVSGSAYLVGGVGITFMKNDDATLAPIRSGVGLRLGANLGYLKYTRAPNWNPF
jgi:hypothetical protein